MITVKNEIFEVPKVLEGLNKLANSKEIPVKVSFKLIKLLKVFDENYRIYMQAKKRVLDIYADKDDSGQPKFDQNGTAVVNDENRVPLMKDLFDLWQVEIDLPLDLIPVKISSLPEGLLSASDLIFLETFITFEE